MCLYIKKNDEAVQAEETFTVYKVMGTLDGMIYSPIRLFQYELGQTVQSPLVPERSDPAHVRDTVELGFHSFANKKEAEAYKKSLDISGGGESVIVECEIPAGSMYFLGTWHYYDLHGLADVVSYASDFLTPIKLIG